MAAESFTELFDLSAAISYQCQHMSLSRLGVIENVSLKKTPTRDCSLVHCSAAVRSTTQGIPTTLISGYQ